MCSLTGFLTAFVAPFEIFTAEPDAGYIFGVFSTNYFHNAIDILVGLWGIASFTSVSGAIVFNRIFAILYAASAILGLLPFANTLFGLAPLFGNTIWLNAITAAIAFYYGCVKSAPLAALSPSDVQPSL